MSKDHIGEFENLCLLGVWRLQPLAYGGAVRQEIIDRTDRICGTSAVYATLERLETKGYLRTSVKPRERAHMGRQAYIFYAITLDGILAVRQHEGRIRQMWDGLPQP